MNTQDCSLTQLLKIALKKSMRNDKTNGELKHYSLDELLSAAQYHLHEEWDFLRNVDRIKEDLSSNPIKITEENPRRLRTPLFENLLNLDRLAAGLRPFEFGNNSFTLPYLGKGVQ